MSILERLLAKTNKETSTGCWEWTAKSRVRGYGVIKTNGRQRLAHRVSYELHSGQIPNGLFVCHRCDNRLCINPEHLFVGTALDNNRDAIVKGRAFHPSGENRPDAKLSAIDVQEIRRSMLSQRALAKQYGVAKGTIQNILNGTKWPGV